MRLFGGLLLISSLSSCWTRINKPTVNYKVYGNKAIYMPVSMAKQFSYSPTAMPVINPGKIYVKGNYIYQAEQGKGIHIINNTNPSSATRVGFISIYGCTEISISGNLLYTNNLDDLLVIDVSDLTNVHLVKRVVKTFPNGLIDYYQAQNPPSNGYYECPRSDSGVVAGWRQDSILYWCLY